MGNKKSLFKYFCVGAVIGIGFSILLGLLTYPYDDPGMDGASAYFGIMMCLITPIIALVCGLAGLYICHDAQNNPDE